VTVLVSGGSGDDSVKHDDMWLLHPRSGRSDKVIIN